MEDPHRTAGITRTCSAPPGVHWWCGNQGAVCNPLPSRQLTVTAVHKNMSGAPSPDHPHPSSKVHILELLLLSIPLAQQVVHRTRWACLSSWVADPVVFFFSPGFSFQNGLSWLKLHQYGKAAQLFTLPAWHMHTCNDPKKGIWRSSATNRTRPVQSVACKKSLDQNLGCCWLATPSHSNKWFSSSSFCYIKERGGGAV